MSTDSLESLRRFFENSPAARKAIAPLAPGAEVGLVLDGGPARFTVASGKARVEEGPAAGPDFTLTLPGEAVRRITAIEGADVGALGVAFFGLVLSKDAAAKVRIRIDAPTDAQLSIHRHWRREGGPLAPRQRGQESEGGHRSPAGAMTLPRRDRELQPWVLGVRGRSTSSIRSSFFGSGSSMGGGGTPSR